LRAIKPASKEEIGRALINLSRLKSPASIESLKEVMDSNDPFLSVMAAYALGETGIRKGSNFLRICSVRLLKYYPVPGIY